MLKKGVTIASVSALFFSFLSLESSRENTYLVYAIFSFIVLFTTVIKSIYRHEIRLSTVDIYSSIFILLLFIRNLFVNNLSITTISSLIICPLFYFNLKDQLFRDNQLFTRVLLIAILVVNFYSWGQLYYFNHIGYITRFYVGLWGNQGIYAIFLGISCIFSFWSIHQNKNLIKAEKIFATILIINNMILIVFLQSRTAILVVITFCIFPLVIKYIQKWDKYKYLYYCAGLLLCVLLLGFLFKQESTLGRFLIYKVSCKIFLDYFFFGSGINSFQSIYPTYQAEYYKSGNMNEDEILLAGNTHYAFNEPLQLACECGILGIVIFLYYIYKIGNKDNRIVKIVAISVIFTSLFYYVFHSTSIFVFTLLLGAFLFRNEKIKLIISSWKSRVIYLIVIIFCIYSIALFSYKYTSINRIISLHSRGKDTIEEYTSIKNILYDNPVYLYYYAKKLNSLDYNIESLKILSKYESFVISYDSELFKGLIYMKLKDYLNAEKCFEHAICIYPSKFRARYELLKLYQEQNRYQEALYEAIDIINLPEKIPSSATLAIKLEAQEFIDTQESK